MTGTKSTIRIASVQFPLGKIERFEELETQIESYFKAAKESGADLLLFPEYFSLQLVGLIEERKDEAKIFREVAQHSPRVLNLFEHHAKSYGLYAVAGSLPVNENNQLFNDSYLFTPDQIRLQQGKLNATSYERDLLGMSCRDKLNLIDTEFGRMVINICYDIEFPEVSRVATTEGARIILVPSWTDDIQGFTRVRICARARCIENHIYVVQSSVVGSLGREPAVGNLYGQSAILSPADGIFPVGGIIKEGTANQDDLVVADLDLELLDKVRAHGATLPVSDSEKLTDRAIRTEIVSV
ncbi:MAG: carbon-nitrogen hydrolase family protein [Cyanobacteriota/Melainabacteria group bacterium]